jgi:hypothetical protein
MTESPWLYPKDISFAVYPTDIRFPHHTRRQLRILNTLAGESILYPEERKGVDYLYGDAGEAFLAAHPDY